MRTFTSVVSSQFSIVLSRKIPQLSQKHAMLTRKLRSSLNLQQAIMTVEANLEDINKIAKTVTLEYFNQMYIDPRSNKSSVYSSLFQTIMKLQNLSLYEMVLKLSTFEKIIFVFGNQECEEYFIQSIKKCEDEILEMMDREQVDLYGCFSIFLVFRIQKYPRLVRKVLGLLNEKILRFENTLNIQKTIGLLIHQLNFIEWWMIRENRNLIEFLTNYTNTAIFADNEVIIGAFIKFQEMKLHKVGLRRIPLHIYEISQCLKKKNLSIEDICRILKNWNFPASFDPQLRHMFKRKLLNFPNFALVHQKNIPYKIFSTEEINQIYATKESRAYLWFQLVYFTSSETSKYFYRGVIVDHLREQINRKYNEKHTNYKNDKYSQQASRLIYVSYQFYKLGESESLQKIKNILCRYFTSLGYYKTMSQFPFINFMTLYILFEGDNEIVGEIDNVLETVIQKRRNRAKYTNFKDNCLLVIQDFIEVNITKVRDTVIRFINELINESDAFDFKFDCPILIEIINSKEEKRLTEAKDKLLKKMSVQDFDIFVDYFILSERKTFKGVQEIVKVFMDRKIGIQKFLEFLSCMQNKTISNYQGKLQTTINNYLQGYKNKIKLDFNNLNDISRVLSMLLEYSNEGFVKKLYMDSLEAIVQQLNSENAKPRQKGERLILDLIFKFEQMMDVNLTSVWNQAILGKVYSILKILVLVNNSLLVRVKMLQFCCVYEKYLGLDSANNIQNLYVIKQELKSKQNPLWFCQIYLILLKLNSINKLQLEGHEVAEYSAIINSGVKCSILSMYRLKNEINSLTFYLKINKVNVQQVERIIEPIIMNALSTYRQQLPFNIVKIYMKFYYSINKIESIQPSIRYFLNNSYVSIHALSYILNMYPTQKINVNLCNLIVKRIQNLKYMLSQHSYSLNLLFFFEKLFFRIPEQYQQLMGILLKNTQSKLLANIQSLQSKQNKMSQSQKSYVLGRYPLYMYICIKNNNVGNPIFEYLLGHVRKYPNDLLDKINNNNILRFINQLVYIYVAHSDNNNNSNNVNNSNSSDVSQLNRQLNTHLFFPLFSKTLKEELQNKSVHFYFNWKINNFIIPCYLPDQNQAIIICNKMNENIADNEYPYNGIVKFYAEVGKKVALGLKWKGYDVNTQKYFEI